MDYFYTGFTEKPIGGIQFTEAQCTVRFFYNSCALKADLRTTFLYMTQSNLPISKHYTFTVLLLHFYEQNFDLFIVIFHCSQNWRGCQKILKVSLK